MEIVSYAQLRVYNALKMNASPVAQLIISRADNVSLRHFLSLILSLFSSLLETTQQIIQLKMQKVPLLSLSMI